jgi:hypothetical protein
MSTMFKHLRVLVFLLLLTSFSVASFSQKKHVALVSFYSDKKIGGADKVIESLIKNPAFDLKPVLNKAYDRFVNEFAKDFPFDLIAKNVVTSNVQFQKFESAYMADTSKGLNKLVGLQYAIVDGLKFAIGANENLGLLKDDKKDPCIIQNMFETADGVMLVAMDYEFSSKAMGFAAGVTANISIALFDKKCDKVFRIRESASSKGKVPAVAGIPIMKAEKIQPLCEDATNELFDDLKGKIGKIVKKSAKNFK